MEGTSESGIFYYDKEYWSPPNNCYPTWDDVCRFIWSRTCYTAKPLLSLTQATYEVAKFVNGIWVAGDGCPLSIRQIERLYIDKVKPMYEKYKRGDAKGLKRSHKKSTQTSTKSQALPKRKSSRLSSTDIVTGSTPSTPLQTELQTELLTPTTTNAAASFSPQKVESGKQVIRKSARQDLQENKRYLKWMEDYGTQLFNVFSLSQMVKAKKEGRAFDSEFYEDQKDPHQRTLIIARMRVRKEFYEQEKRLERRKASQYARILSQRGEITEDDMAQIDKFDDELEEPQEETFSPLIKTPLAMQELSISSAHTHSTIQTRSGKCKRTIDFVEKADITTQTDESGSFFPPVSTRKSRTSTLCNPSYLQAGLLMMSVGNQSAAQAVLNMYIIDTEIYKQKRSLPLQMQKRYLKQLNTLKRLKAVTNEHEDGSNVDSNAKENVDSDNVTNENDMDVLLSAEINPDKDEQDKKIIESAEQSIRSMKEYNKTHLNEILPDPRSIRESHRVASVFLEGKVGEEMIDAGRSSLMPDGTSRAKVGKIGASLVHVGEKVRALKLQKMGNDSQANWVDTIIHQLNRLATAADISITDIYKTIRAIISDACSVNKGLAVALSAQLGTEWLPGQLYCCIHLVLGFQTGINKLWMQYQSAVGYEKMYPKITGMELDMEEKCLIKQMLECYLRLTADRWQARAWNKFEEFDQFCKDNDIHNFTQQLHGNRFGELEKCCAIGVYTLDTWLKFIETFSNIRNALAIFLRDTCHLADICNFLWLGPALIGIHLTEPYLLLLLEKKVTHLDLLDILPKLYKELAEYPCSLAQITKPALMSLARGWINPLSPQAPYHPEICNGIRRAIERCDILTLDNYMREMCSIMAIILKRQRGDAYGFGESSNLSDLITNQFTKEELETAVTHTKDVENLFGVEDAILTRFGGHAFQKSTDDLIIRYSKDLLPEPSEWCTARMRRKKRELDIIQSSFNEQQEALLKAGVSKSDAIILQEENRVHRVVQLCRKSHDGPIASEEELNDICVKYKKDEKALRSALIYEIRYRKFTVKNIKEDNPLFKQNNLSVDQLKGNLRLLLAKTDRSLASTVTMTDLEEVICKTSQIDGPEELENSTDNIVTNQRHIIQDDNQVTENWPPKIGDHIAANFEDGFYIGEVLSIIDNETVTVSYMKPKTVLTASTSEHKRKFWIWPYPQDIHETNRKCVLDLRPAGLTLAIPPSTKRMLVFSLGNAELLEIFFAEATETI